MRLSRQTGRDYGRSDLSGDIMCLRSPHSVYGVKEVDNKQW